MNDAAACWQRALECFNSGDLDQSLRLAVQLKDTTEFRGISCLLSGCIAEKKGDLEEAATQYRLAFAESPDDTTVLQALAAALLFLNRPSEAIPLLTHAANLNPLLTDAWTNLAAAYLALNRLTEAELCARRAVELKEDCVSRTNLGRILCGKGLQEEAVEQFRKALQLKPDYLTAHTNLLLALCYSDSQTPESICREHLAFARTAAEPISKACIAPLLKPVEDGRIVRIGYVSPDFRAHSVGFFIESVLCCHDRSQFEIFCYSDVLNEDEVTQRFKRYPVTWRSVRKLDDQKLSDLIRADAIDILVDLAGHTADNRLLCFARKPAPVQVTWMGYPATTGMSAMGYRLVDVITDPPDSPVCTAETLVRLPGCFLCYQPPSDAPDVGPAPFCANGYVTFGSFNNMAKITPLTLDIWAAVLHNVPDSRLLVKCKQLADEGTRQVMQDRLGERGITSDRLLLHQPINASLEHLALYNQVDIALDTHPYNGTTTTCEALFMGVPVISYPGVTHASRVSASLLHAANLSRLVCSRPDEVPERAAALAADRPQLESLRLSLRHSLLSSPLCNASAFTKGLENALLQVCRTTIREQTANYREG